MEYLPHLLELRRRLLYCAGVFIAVFIPLIIYSGELYSLVAQPILNTLPQGSLLIATEVTTPFTAPLKLALFSTFVLLVPYWFYHLWAFVAPGLYRSEKRTLAPLIFLSILLFFSGMIFAHCIVCPMALAFFSHLAPKGVTIMTDLTHYLNFILALYISFGLAFQVPIVTFLLLKLGITTPESLKKHRPYIIVGAFIVGMILTPPDVISQIMLAIPLLLLFEGGLLLAKWGIRPKAALSE